MVRQTFADRRFGEGLGEQEHVGRAGARDRSHGIEEILGQPDGLANCGEDHVGEGQCIGIGVGTAAERRHALVNRCRGVRHRPHNGDAFEGVLEHRQRYTSRQADHYLPGLDQIFDLPEQVLDILRLHRNDEYVPLIDRRRRVECGLDRRSSLGLPSALLPANQQDDVFRLPAGPKQTLGEDLSHRTCTEHGNGWVSHGQDDTRRMPLFRNRSRATERYAPGMEQRSPALEPTLLWIVTGYRIFAALWLTLLGAVAVGSDDTVVDRPGVVAATIALVLVWAALTTTLRVIRPEFAAMWWLVAVDLVISCWSMVAGDFAGTIQFAGGYPLVGALTAIYAYGWAGGAVGAAALTVTGLSRVIGADDSVPQDVANSIAHLFSVGAGAGVAAILRTSDKRRAAAEEALEKERTERIRAEEHAEMAAHLHDSVLQTLALIQRDSAATPDIRGIARHQERELRSWLFPDQGANATGPGGFKEALVGACSEIEDIGEAQVEVVVVGDTTAEVAPIVKAAREAMLNASKHAGVETISVYGEVADGEVLVFVKDRGPGFEPAAVPESRRGIRDSIIGRMERHGGSAEIVSERGAGTEVRLRLPTGDA